MGNGGGLEKLTSITIDCCQGVTDVGLEAIGKDCPNHVEMSGLEGVTDGGFLPLMESFEAGLVKVQSVALSISKARTQLE
ncbi:hypothetical protein VNO78_32905 [Psophocarpus tetragonolobus]|uniref:Uncharacterized protein n=1 Tax=Psophocarpus tetragonolobus TaxID=3891 RepID=A0AAN9NXF1_PSOTE